MNDAHSPPDPATVEQPSEAVRSGQARARSNQGPSLVFSHLELVWVQRLVEDQPLTVGRDTDVTVAIGDPSVSRRHAEFENHAGVVTFRDLGSTNGTFLNGQRVDRAVIKVGDQVQIGNVAVTLHVGAPRIDSGAALPHDQFMTALEAEVDRARTFGRGFAVATLRPCSPEHPLPLEALLGRLRLVDRCGRFGDGSVELVLPELDVPQAESLLAPLEVYAGVACFPKDGLTGEALLEASRLASQRASAAGPLQRAYSRPVAVDQEIVCLSPGMQEVFLTVDRAASAIVPVLIRGETGTGKEVLARAIHDRGPRSKRRFVAINCAAIPATLLESVLFGHERGAFTGAQSTSPGVFEEADGGTLLLDEVGELSLAAQAALLRILETRTVKRLGSTQELRLDVRVVSATHRDLDQMVATGAFREDLYYRLNTLTIEVPPLRERPEEISPLADRFRALANLANGRAVTGIGPEATRILLQHSWPGNIRELRNTVEHAVVIAAGPIIQPEDLSRRTRDAVAKARNLPQSGRPPQRGSLREELERFEARLILEALEASQGNKTEAARLLDLPLRTLSRKVAQHGIRRAGFEVEDDSSGHE